MSVTTLPVQRAAHRTATGTLDLLPYGSKTLLSATVERRSLKESLTALLRPLALTFRPEKRQAPDRAHGTASAHRPAGHVGRTGTLDRLYSTPWSKELFDSLQFQFQDARAATPTPIAND